ncbi:MAG: DUF1501 domain-containing protein, partial [Planctomycetota bacterium]|nr:DUF1501 domain-containing protein [Planctomycetota bacterium]
VQINGGWDGLNILPEVDHPNYALARPTIGLPKAKVLTLEAGAKHYWHPSMAAFKTLYDNGDLAIIENIGYPNPNLSHFTSEKKWYAGDATVRSAATGWLSHYLTKGYSGSFQIPAIDLEARLNGAFLGSRVPVFRRIADYQFLFDTNYYARLDNSTQLETLLSNGAVTRLGDNNVQFVADSTVDAVNDSALLQSVGSSYSPRATYPNGRFAESLQVVSRYITGGLKSQIYYTNTGGFDHHANEAVASAPETGDFANKIEAVSASIKAFLDDVKAYGKEKKVVVMVFSEFGRRFGENGAVGTDHGHGGVAFLAGEPVTGGRYGTPPDLDQATTPYDRYYIPFDTRSTDFRSMYATVIENWFGVNHSTILNGTYPLLGAL